MSPGDWKTEIEGKNNFLFILHSPFSSLFVHGDSKNQEENLQKKWREVLTTSMASGMHQGQDFSSSSQRMTSLSISNSVVLMESVIRKWRFGRKYVYGEVNRAQCLPQKPTLVGAKTIGSEVFLFDYARHSAKPQSSECDLDLGLMGHEQEGYGLAWSSFKEESMKKNTEFLVKQMNWPLKAVVSTPAVLGYSLEKRTDVIQALIVKGLLGSELPPMSPVLA
ncbi:unnamed protein product [Microthlaspi erraticum]|uniref:Uncharacterized protein n=1 Tax=Microthlaspi erraticum TaxID=1685480 RepID=A0A6D2JAI5_9BRAS|nr:unnamed protein product [Microthlaspi erraticum]